MKFNAKFLVAILTVTAGGMSLAPAAFAGEGGIAGAASFHLNNNGKVTDAAVAAAIGKTSAYAGANNDLDEGLDAFAAGTGGTINMDNDSNYIRSIGGENATQLGTAQRNNLTNHTINLNATSTGNGTFVNIREAE